jgi:site-specific DNA recombinase
MQVMISSKFSSRRPVNGRSDPRNPTEGDNPLSLPRVHLQIVDDDTWLAVERRLAAVHAKYTKNADGSPKGRALPGRASSYLFSSLLACGVCGSSMVISGGGGHAQYYRCEASGKRGTCANKLSVREDVLRRNLLDELRHRLTSKAHIAYARKKATEMIATMSRTQGAEVKERRKQLTKVKDQIEKLIDFIADGQGSPTIRDRVKALETEATVLRRQVKALERDATAPISLPTPEEMTELIFDLDRRLLADVSKGREELRRLFKDGMIRLNPQPGGFYVAQSEILPLVLLTTPPSVANQGGRKGTDQDRRYSASSCAGRI